MTNISSIFPHILRYQFLYMYCFTHLVCSDWFCGASPLGFFLQISFFIHSQLLMSSLTSSVPLISFFLSMVFCALLQQLCFNILRIFIIWYHIFPPFFLFKYSLSAFALGCKLLYMVRNFIVFLSIASSSLFLHFTIPVLWLKTDTTLAWIACMVFLAFKLASSIFLIFCYYSFVIISFISLLFTESNCNTPRYLYPFSFGSDYIIHFAELHLFSCLT